MSRGFVNITDRVDEILRASGVQEGLVLVNAMHITASVFINDDESGLHHDYEAWLEQLAPHAPTRHNDTGEDNADAHLKGQVMGHEVVVAVTKGKLDFGHWEQIFYGERRQDRPAFRASERHGAGPPARPHRRGCRCQATQLAQYAARLRPGVGTGRLHVPPLTSR